MKYRGDPCDLFACLIIENEIGKLEDGSPDPCYTCKHSDTEICDQCEDYNKEEAN